MTLKTAAALLLLTAPLFAQQTPKPFTPTEAMQAGIDKDTARHFGDAPADGGPLARDLSPALTPAAIDLATRKVADWQLKQAEPYFDRIWTWSVLYSGFIAASDSTGDPRYREAMLRMSQKYNFALRARLPNADDQSIGQTYLELYLHDDPAIANKAMYTPTQADLDAVLPLTTLKPGDPRIPWWWCDALFMAPPVWARMYKATGDHKYIDYLNAQWKNTSDLLYDPAEHLYARDASYIPKRGQSGKKIFWSRGEGWVMGGLARTLQFLPKDDPRRPFYINQLREISARLASLQDADGLLHADLLDPQHFPAPEVSGTALMLYGMAYGVNEGFLDAATYKPVIAKTWRGLLGHVYDDGRLGDIQQTGAEPAYYPPTASFNYGVGGFLLASSELKRMASAGQTAAQTSSPTDPGARSRPPLPVPANPALPSLFLVGDSTVRNGRGDGANNQMGWGEPLADYFDKSKINVVNRAIGGRSSRSYIAEGTWAETLKLIKPGDVVLFQFGHNDGGDPAEPTRARASLNGTGADTREIENPILKMHETVHTFGWYMDKYVQDTKAKGATPILLSLIPRKTWQNGHIVRSTSGSYGGWTREIATRDHVPFIDLNEITARKYDALGEAAVEPLFGDPHTHTTLAGAIVNAESVVSGLKGLKNDPVAPYFSPKGQAIPPTSVK